LPKRLLSFLRSVIPADPWQLVLLIGSILIFVSPQLSWLPSHLPRYAEYSRSERTDFFIFLVPWFFALNFAGLAAYFVWFWPGKKPVHRIILAVILPSSVALGVIISRTLPLIAPYSSVLQSAYPSQQNWFGRAFSLFKNLPPGFHICLTGILLISFFTILLALGRSSLPLSVGAGDCLQNGDEDWQSMQKLIWVLLGPLFLLIGFLGVGSDLLLGLIHKSALPLSPTQLTAMGSVCSALVFLALVWAIFRQKGLQRVWQSLRLPEPGFALIAVFFSIGIFLIVPISHFLVDRIHWAAHDFGKFAPPVLFFYFSGLPEVSSLMLFLAALGEEIVFRGLVQSTFVRRYGLYVGLFLTNLIWAATHFRSDSYSHLSFGPALLAVLFRVAVCLSLGYVLSWQTLRSGSVLPATITHTVYNMLFYAGFASQFPWSNELRVLFWALLACVLFHFWPVTSETNPMPDLAAISTEPAT
jgi:membrane protease YdiL (CAAX protease family)